MNDVTTITISTSSGWGYIHEAWKDKIVITDHSIRYEFKPGIHTNQKAISWTSRTSNPDHLALYLRLSKAVLDRINNPPTIDYCDVGVITLSLVFLDKSKKSKSFVVLPTDLEPCFSIIRKMVRLATTAPSGMLCNWNGDNC